MAPTLRPRGLKAGSPAKEKPSPATKPPPGRPPSSPGPPARSFALSSSGWLFVYYVGVVKALAERGYHKCVPPPLLHPPRRSVFLAPPPRRAPPLVFSRARVPTILARVFFSLPFFAAATDKISRARFGLAPRLPRDRAPV